ncbi:MAG: M14 family zinc carboxypeptidase [Spirochaetota bacterium]
MLPYIMTAFENASPLEWDSDETSVTLKPLYDHERGTGNRQLTHWHVKLCAKTGTVLTLFIPPAENIYGGKRVNAFVPRIASVYSADGKTWTPFIFERDTDGSLAARITMPADEVFIARAVPYTTAHLSSLVSRIQSDKRVSIQSIGQSVEGRDIPMITLRGGTKSILVRGRAHPWESGGSHFIDGIIEEALRSPDVLASATVHILPMAGIDGVVRGTTRFNGNGLDLNRGFGKEHRFADGAPENLALMRWIEERARANELPVFAMDLHDDDYGNIHVGETGKDAAFDARMKTLDALMRKYTYYTEGLATGISNGTFGAGLKAMFGFDAVIYELNTNWLPAVNAVPLDTTWREFGARFAAMLPELMREAYR